MRLAVLSDIHGNAPALEAVLADVGREAVDTILNLGDHFDGPLQPGRVAEMLLKTEMVSIRGNTDRYLVEAEREDVDAGEQLILDELAGAPLEWLADLPETRVFHDTILMCHGSPRSDETYWLDRKVKSQGMWPATVREIEAELPPGDRFALYCCGHTHLARVVTLPDGTIVFNPGSVGRPSFAMSDPESAGRLSPAAAYAIVQGSGDQWEVELRQVDYDHAFASALALANGSAKWASDLMHGRKR